MFTVPSYIPCSFTNYLNHFKIAFTSDEESEMSLVEKYENNTLIYGHSCRSLFHIFIENFMKHKPDARVLCTPFNYASHISVIDKYIKSENLYICELDNFNKVSKINNKPKEGFDLIIVTHILGQDIDITSILESLHKTHNALIVEDRVLGGSLLTTQNGYADLSFYSMEMDKLPNALGGGYVYIKNQHTEIINKMKTKVKECDRETIYLRIFTLLSIIPSYLLYNCTYILCFLTFIVSQLNKVFPKITMNKLTTLYKKQNSGFNTENYCPSNALVTSMKYNLTNFSLYEKPYYYKYKMFYDCFTPEQQTEFFPWYNGEDIVKGYYNPIYFKNSDRLITRLDKKNITCIKCPTYKLLNMIDNEQQDFLDDLIYLPSLQLLSYSDIVKLTSLIKTTDH